MVKVTCLFKWPDRSLDLVVGRYARLVRSNTMCPIVEYSTGDEYKSKAGHLILSTIGSNSMVIPTVLQVQQITDTARLAFEEVKVCYPILSVAMLVADGHRVLLHWQRRTTTIT